LFWPETTDFVRMAGLFDAIIVPFAGVGIADSVSMLLDADEISQIPILGDRVANSNSNIRSARAGMNESFIAPLSLPKAPSRVYFMFQQPIDTRELNIYDKAASRATYDKVQRAVRAGIEELLHFRKSDPFRDFLPRVSYEVLNQKQAPTAPLNVK
jgi:hypothetical protein